MQSNIFSWIRKQLFLVQIFVALMVNLMAFGQPLQYALNNRAAAYISNYNSYYSAAAVDEKTPAPVGGPVANQNQTTTVVKVLKPTTVANEVDADIIPALEKQGIIGKSENLPIDELTDNIFSFELKNEVKTDKDIYLEYELFGLADGSQAIKSVNDQLATGGSIIKTNKEWTKVKEKLNPSDIQKGKNNIKFTTWEASKYQYMVRNLKLVYEEKALETPIVFHQTEAKSFSGNIAVSGFVADKNTTKVSIMGVDYPLVNGVFEALVIEKEPNATITVSYLDTNGKSVSNVIKVVQLLDKPTELHKETKAAAVAYKNFVKGMRSKLSFAGAKLEVDTLSLAENQNISIAGLRFVDMPTLSPEMVNVTADYFGYRMLPHGNLFGKIPAKVTLKYDEKKLPSGYTAKDIKTFYFDNDQKKWLALEKDTTLNDTKEIVSRTLHFTDFINGIIKVPESPETGSFTPTSIKDIKAAEPTAGVVSIAPPSPNNMGTVNTSFPLKLPAGRSGMQPSLSVNYSSEGGNGWMGLGWDLSVPGVSLDTRWGAPRYDAGTETEIYSMGGGMLTIDAANQNGGTAPSDYTNPNRKDGILRNTNSQRQFYPRIEGSYAEIIRHGGSPSTYWWEVTDKMGNKSFYGGHPSFTVTSGVNNNAVIRTGGNLTIGNISYWGLYRTEDTNGNYVEYIYDDQDSGITGNSPGAGGKQFYIKEIKYTMHSTVQPNFYKVEFIKDGDIYNGSTPYTYTNRADKQLNARNGVVQVTKNLLKEVKIGFQEGTTLKPIRSYRFDYGLHAFNKTQLTKIAEHDANGDLFYANTMEYEKNGNNGNPGSINDVDPVTNANFFGPQTSVIVDTPFQGNQKGDLILLADPVSVLGSTEMGGGIGVVI